MTRCIAYWACQVLGWGTYSAIGLVFTASVVGWQPSLIIGYVLFFLYSIALTHLLRRQIRNRQWLSLPTARMIPRLVGAGILTGLVQASLVIGINLAFKGGRISRPTDIPGLTIGIVSITVIWTFLYVGITSTESALKMKLALRDAELRALEGQVNPHFLFNCLNTIRGMIVEDAELAQDMITRLANILRYNLQRDRAYTVPLEREIAVVADYLAIESIRFDNRLRVHVVVDPNAAQVPVPSMLVQTLVENAVKHGIAQSPDEGEISIRAAIRPHGKSEALSIEVLNTGQLCEPAADVAQNGTRIGLANARDRLRLLYGDRASLELANHNGSTVAATVLIPYENFNR